MNLKHNFLLLFAVVIATNVLAQTGNDLKLWYKKPAEKWVEALPIGNGRLGAMIFGGIDEDRIQFNEETLWTGYPRDYNRKGAWQYLDSIRSLLFAGKQQEAEALAESEFMGLQSSEGDKDTWLKNMRSLKGINGNPALPAFDDSEWKTMEVPAYEGWETVGFEGLDGAVWFRTSINLPAGWENEDLVIDLNRIREHDFTYVNGTLVGSMQGLDPRKYKIPATVLKPGKNTIAVQVLNLYDKGGIAGYKDTSRHIGLYPVGKEEQLLSLNGNWKYFIQSDEPPATPRYQADYQPFGDLVLNFPTITNATNYRRELDIANAIAHTTYNNAGVSYTREYMASQPAQAMLVHLTASIPGRINFSAILSSPHKYHEVKKLNDHALTLSVKVKYGALNGVADLQVNIVNGTIKNEGDKLVISNADEATIYLTAATNYKNYHDISADPVSLAGNALKAAAQKSYAVQKAAHIKEYQDYFNTFSISFKGSENSELPTDERLQKFASSNDASFAALYAQYGRYLLISSSRPGTRPANLQGIWNDLLTPPWGSKYTTNINAEMNYWPAELLNLSKLHQPLFGMIDDLHKTGTETAGEYYNAPGWVLHHNTDLWRGTAPINASNHGIWVTGGAWLCRHLWEHFLFTQDTAFLRSKAYPVMKDAALFFNRFLVKDPATGWLISTPSNSPEHGGLVAGPSMDHQVIRALFRSVIEASKILKTDVTLRDTLTNKLSKIAPDQVGKYGQLQEWLQDKDDPNDKHRHVSHLWAVYPGNEINWDEKPLLMKAAEESLRERGDAATGWSLGWKINLWARFKEGDHAYKLLQMLLSPANGGAGSYPNLFDAHPPFQVDGNFGGAAGIGEMLIQSHTNYIDILPALPSAFATGSVQGLCARGGFTIDMNWNNGSLERLTLYSKAGDDCLLRYKGKIVLIKTAKGKSYSFDGQLSKLP